MKIRKINDVVKIDNEIFTTYLNKYLSFFKKYHSISLFISDNEKNTWKIKFEQKFIIHSLGLQKFDNIKCKKLKKELKKSFEKQQPNIGFFNYKEDIENYYNSKINGNHFRFFFLKFNAIIKLIENNESTNSENSHYNHLFNSFINIKEVIQKDKYFEKRNVFKNSDYCFFNDDFGLCVQKSDTDIFNNPLIDNSYVNKQGKKYLYFHPISILKTDNVMLKKIKQYSKNVDHCYYNERDEKFNELNNKK